MALFDAGSELRNSIAPGRVTGRWVAQRPHRVIRRLWIAGFAALICLGIGAADRSAVAESLRDVTLRMNWSAVGDQSYFFYGVAQGYFEEEGLRVTIEDGKGSLLTAQDVDAGGAQFGMVAGTAAAIAIMAGAEIISVATPVGRNSWGLIVDAESGIETVADLPGKQVLVSAGSPETMFLPAVLNAAGVDINSVQLLNVDAAAKFASYARGMGDAVGTVAPTILLQVNPLRPSKTLLFSDAGAEFPDYAIVVQRAFLEENKDVVEGFLRATFRALAESLTNPAPAIQALATARPEADADLLAQQFEVMRPHFCSDGQSGMPYGFNPPSEWEQGIELLVEFGDVRATEAPPMDDVFTNEFFEGEGSVSVETCP